MAACVPITLEKIRAEVWMGSMLLARTPFVQNFSVSKSRNQISNTFNVTFEMVAGLSFPLGENLEIRAGTKGNLKTVFTGIIETNTASPAWGKPSYFLVVLTGRGVLSNLENKKFSRRLSSTGQGLFCAITSTAGNRPSAYWNLDKRVNSGNQQTLADHPNPAVATGENSPFIKLSDAGGNQATGGTAAEIAGKGTGGGEGSGEGFRIHTHEDLDQGGPAFAVYSSD